MKPEYPYRPMTPSQLEPWLEAITDTIDGQPPEIRDRLRQAIGSGLYDVEKADLEELVIDVRGIGELRVVKVALPPAARAN